MAINFTKKDNFIMKTTVKGVHPKADDSKRRMNLMKKMTFFTLTLLVLSTISLQTTFAQDMSFSPDGTALASGSDDGTVKLWDVTTHENIATLQGHTNWVYSVSFSPDGATLASGSWDGTIKLWDVATHENIATLQRPLENWSLPMSFSPDGTVLASGAADGTVKLWDVATHENIATLQGHLEDSFILVSFSPDSTTLASGSSDGTVKLWDVATHENIATLEGHTDYVSSVSFSPDGTTLASGSSDGTVKLWDVATRTNIATLEGHTDYVSSVSFSPDGTTLASASDDGIIKLWDVETHENIATLQGHGDYGPGVSFSALFSPDGTLLASWGGFGGEVELWDVATHENIATLHTGWVSYVAFSPDGKTLASGPGELWDVAEELRTRPNTLVKISGDEQQGTPGAALAHPLVVEVRDQYDNPLPDAQVTFTVTDGGGQLSEQFTVEHATTDANGQAELTLTLALNPGTNTVEVTIAGHEPVTFNAEGILILVKISGDDQQGTFGSILANPLVVEVRDRDNNPFLGAQVTFTVTGYGDEGTVTYGEGRLSGQFTVEHVTTDANGRAERTFTLGPNLVINIIEVTIAGHEPVTFHAVGNSPYQIATLEGHGDSVRAVSFSPDGTLLASGGGEGFQEDGTVKLWDVATKQNIATLEGHTAGVFSVSFSPDGSTLASGSGDGTVKLWDVATKQNIATFKHAVGEVASVAFSPDGTLLASASLSFSFFDANLDDGTVELWDVATKQNIATLQVIATSVAFSSVAFSPDGTQLASGTLDGTVELWDVATKQNIATLQGHTYWVWSVAFSPDGKTLASGALGEAATTKLWNVATRENIATLQAPGVSVTFSLDGTLLASASDEVGLWDAGTGENIAILQGHTDLVLSVAFSPDGTTLASGSEDDTVKLWDVSEWMGPRPTDVRGPSATKMNVTDGEEADLEVLNRDGIIIEFDENIVSSSLKLTYGDADSTDLGWESTVKDNSVTLTPIEGQELVHETFYVVRGTVRDGVGNETDLMLTFVAVKPPGATPNALEADINGDGVVNILDLVLVASNLGQTGQNAGDVNGDGVVNILDLVKVAGALGNAAAAPSLHPQALEMFTAADVQQWLTQAQHLKLTDATSQRGILFLEQLLAALTPKETALLPNYPNPFNPETWIPYRLAKDAFVTLTIYDGSGRVVRTLDVGHRTAAFYESRSKAIHWDGRNEFGEQVASGVYFYHLSAGDYSATRKMLILK